MLEKYLDEISNTDSEVIEALKDAAHFLITHYCKIRDQIETRRCYWDDKSKIWETKDGKIAFTVLAMDQEETEIVGYRTFTNVFNVTGRVARSETSRTVQ